VRKASRVASSPRPRQLVAVKAERSSGVKPEAQAKNRKF
jgi:hypothetical protein